MSSQTTTERLVESAGLQLASLWRLTARQSEQITALQCTVKMLLNDRGTGSVIPENPAAGYNRPLTKEKLAEMRARVFQSQLDFYRVNPTKAEKVLDSISLQEIKDYLSKRRRDS